MIQNTSFANIYVVQFQINQKRRRKTDKFL